MTRSITDNLSFLSGKRRSNHKPFSVVGTNVRGEDFRMDYRTRSDAEDFRDEINGKGGKCVVSQNPKERKS